MHQQQSKSGRELAQGTPFMLVKIGFPNLGLRGQGLASNTFRSAPSSPAFSMTSLSTTLHFVTSLTSA